MKRADAVGCEDAEKPRIGVRVPARNVEPIEAETIEGMTGLSDHDALSQLIELADHPGHGIDGNVIGEYQPGRRIDLATYWQARRRRWLPCNQHSPGCNRVVLGGPNHLLQLGRE